MLQIYHQKKEAHEQELQQQQRAAASVHQRDIERLEQCPRQQPGDNSQLSEIRQVPSKPHRDMTTEQEPQSAVSNVVGLVEKGQLVQSTKSSSLPLMSMSRMNKQPQSFPDRLALLQKQKQMEDSRVYARSYVRALKVSSEITLCHKKGPLFSWL